MLQKNIFLSSEGDRWFDRNHKKRRKDPIFEEICKILKSYNNNENFKFLEVGCSNGLRLSKLSKLFKNFKFFGIDPSKKAIKNNNNRNIYLSIGTADKLKFKKKSFDIILYGFCLYLCDKKSHNKILNEANNILNKKGKVLIHDFYTSKDQQVSYKYHPKIFSNKLDFTKIFRKKFSLTKLHILKTKERKIKNTDNKTAFFILERK